jgi:hypothetical protein
MADYASRRPNLFTAMIKNSGENGDLKSLTFEENRKKFYTVPAQV